MAKLQEFGEFVRSASSTIEAPVVRKLRESFPAPAADAAPVPAPRAAATARTADKPRAVEAAPAVVAAATCSRCARADDSGRRPRCPEHRRLPGSRRTSGARSRRGRRDRDASGHTGCSTPGRRSTTRAGRSASDLRSAADGQQPLHLSSSDRTSPGRRPDDGSWCAPPDRARRRCSAKARHAAASGRPRRQPALARHDAAAASARWFHRPG